MSDETRVFHKDLFLFEVDSGRSVRIFDGFYIGRVECHWNVVNDPSISRRHVVIHVETSRVLIEDLNTKNRTRLNGKPLEPGMKYLLNLGDEIEIGNHKFVFKNEATGEEVSAAIPAVPQQEETPPRLPVIEVPGFRDERELPATDISSGAFTLGIAGDAADAQKDPSAPIELALTPPPAIQSSFAMSSAPFSVDKPPAFEPPPLFPPTAPPKKIVVPPAPPLERHHKIQASMQPSVIKDIFLFLRFKHFGKLQWFSLWMASDYLSWILLKDLRLSLMIQGLPRSASDFAATLGVAFLISYVICYFPSWLVIKRSSGSLRIKLLAPASAFAMVALTLWIASVNGYNESSRLNQLMGYCVSQFDETQCRELSQTSNDLMASLSPEVQNQIKERLAAAQNPPQQPADPTMMQPPQEPAPQVIPQVAQQNEAQPGADRAPASQPQQQPESQPQSEPAPAWNEDPPPLAPSLEFFDQN